MKKGELWDVSVLAEKGVDEECVIHSIKKNLDGSITANVRVNAYHIDEKEDCYTGVVDLRLRKEEE